VILIWSQHVSHKEDLKKLKNIPKRPTTWRHIEGKLRSICFDVEEFCWVAQVRSRRCVFAQELRPTSCRSRRSRATMPSTYIRDRITMRGGETAAWLLWQISSDVAYGPLPRWSVLRNRSATVLARRWSGTRLIHSRLSRGAYRTCVRPRA
jgi:hypothetical protein